MTTLRTPVADLRIGHQILRGRLWFEVKAINSRPRSRTRDVVCRVVSSGNAKDSAVTFNLRTDSTVEVAAQP